MGESGTTVTSRPVSRAASRQQSRAPSRAVSRQGVQEVPVVQEKSRAPSRQEPSRAPSRQDQAPSRVEPIRVPSRQEVPRAADIVAEIKDMGERVPSRLRVVSRPASRAKSAAANEEEEGWEWDNGDGDW